MKQLWWKHFPDKSRTAYVKAPSSTESQLFYVGDRVRLVGKPEKARQVLNVRWHCFRHEWVYVVETDAPVEMKNWIYWFASQLTTDKEAEESLND